MGVGFAPRADSEEAGATDGASTRILVRARRFRLGRFSCPPGSRRWREINETPAAPHVAFGGTNVVIHHLGREPVLANRNHAVFYDAGQRYLRRLADPAGDHCLFVELDPGLAAELVGDAGFPFTHGPLSARALLLLELVARRGDDGLAAEETVLEALEAAAGAASLLRRGRPARVATDLAHAELAESVKEHLASDPAASPSLGELARRFHVSEFHLARVFRARTGYTLRGYRTQLRLRLALDRLAGAEVDLSRLALELGFASHSHFTDSFRAAFGFPPSAVRDDGPGVLRRARSEQGHGSACFPGRPTLVACTRTSSTSGSASGRSGGTAGRERTASPSTSTSGSSSRSSTAARASPCAG